MSPDELNLRLLTVLAAPLTAGGFSAPFRVPCRFAGVNGQVALDHVRSLSKQRCLRCLGTLDASASKDVLTQLRAMFEE